MRTPVPALALVGAVLTLSALQARPVNGEATGSKCAWDESTELCLPASLAATEGMALDVTDLLNECLMHEDMAPTIGCSAGAPAGCISHEFTDKPGVMFCVNQGFKGTSYMAFKDLEAASMECLEAELDIQCRPVLMAWYDTLGCSTCAATEQAIRSCVAKQTSGDCGSGTFDREVVDSLLSTPPLSDPASTPLAADEPSVLLTAAGTPEFAFAEPVEGPVAMAPFEVPEEPFEVEGPGVVVTVVEVAESFEPLGAPSPDAVEVAPLPMLLSDTPVEGPEEAGVGEFVEGPMGAEAPAGSDYEEDYYGEPLTVFEAPEPAVAQEPEEVDEIPEATKPPRMAVSRLDFRREHQEQH